MFINRPYSHLPVKIFESRKNQNWRDHCKVKIAFTKSFQFIIFCAISNVVFFLHGVAPPFGKDIDMYSVRCLLFKSYVCIDFHPTQWLRCVAW